LDWQKNSKVKVVIKFSYFHAETFLEAQKSKKSLSRVPMFFSSDRSIWMPQIHNFMLILKSGDWLLYQAP
jgi:hypothetical protein